jgi:DNA-binding GntR family transcriptional regulator
MQLARLIGVSRTPVNNALQILAKEGYLDFVPNKGYIVRQLNGEEVEALGEMRTILEIGTVAKAIRRMTGEKLSRVEDAMIACEQAASRACDRAFYLLDIRFHASIMAMAENHLLVSHYLEICRRAALGFQEYPLPARPDGKTVSEHNELFQAVRSRDVEGAKELIARHRVGQSEMPVPALFLIFGGHRVSGNARQAVEYQAG